MGSLLERLQAREAVARARVEGLRAEMDRLAEQLAEGGSPGPGFRPG